MHHPYQVIAPFAPPGDPKHKFLLAASGPRLVVVDLEDGTTASTWQPSLPGVEQAILEEDVANDEAGRPPNKKRRMHIEKPPANITGISVTPDASHVIVLTGEDKAIRVFSICPAGKLEELSCRNMPKRPSAVAFLRDPERIVCADKFGDVYLLPLLLNPDDVLPNAPPKKSTKAFVPTATNLTVHSKANRRALENQLKQAKEQSSAETEEKPTFRCDLILGHVSMLTDVITATDSSHAHPKPRHYLITADRDEHIRVSRAPPQAYVTESFCLGHHEFVSKLKLVRPDILVSGGGDDELFVWHWLSGECRLKVNIKDAIGRLNLQDGGEETNSVPKVALHGIWLLPEPSGETSRVLVSSEGIPALFHVPIETLVSATEAPQVDVLRLPGNVLGVAVFDGKMIISIDTIHKPGSTDIDESTDFKPRLVGFNFETRISSGSANIEPDDHLERLLVEANELTTVEWHEKELRNLLYGMGNLRKHRGQGGESEMGTETGDGLA